MKRKPTGIEMRKPMYQIESASVKEWVRIMEIINKTIGAIRTARIYGSSNGLTAAGSLVLEKYLLTKLTLSTLTIFPE